MSQPLGLTVVFDPKTLVVIQVQISGNATHMLANRTVCKGVLEEAKRHVDKHVDKLESGEKKSIVLASGPLPPMNGDPH